MKLKAIDTPYKNYLFRSRLEAKWAYYFDLFNVRWEYEKEGYELGDGIRYLPDFYFPDYRIYAEVKPILPTFKEHSKCKRLANLTQCKVIELVGLPSNRPMNVIMPSKRYVCSKCGKKEEYDENDKRECCGCKVKHKVENVIYQSEAILLFHCDKDSYKPLYFTTIHDHYTENPIILENIKKANQVRFEFLT